MLHLREAITAKRICLRCRAMPPGHPDRGEGPCLTCGDSGFVLDAPAALDVAHLQGAESLPGLLVRLAEAISDQRQQEARADSPETAVVAAARRSGLAMAAVAVQALICRPNRTFGRTHAQTPLLH